MNDHAKGDVVPATEAEQSQHAMPAREIIKPLPWRSRIASMPYIPGGSTHQLEGLRDLLENVGRLDGLLTSSVPDGEGGDETLRKATQQIAPSGLLDRLDRDHIALSKSARQWLDTGDDYWLIASFHRHIRFVGEMLNELRNAPMTIRDLVQIANEKYQLNWSTPDQTRRRSTWFICMGLMEYRTKKLIELSDLGREYCDLLTPGAPGTGSPAHRTAQPVVVPATPVHIEQLLTDLTPAMLASRHPVLGYIPRGGGDSDVVGALEILVNGCSPAISRTGLMEFAEQSLHVGESSFGAALTTLTKSGLVEETGLNIFSPTVWAQEWIESNEPLNLVRIFHARFLFLLEIIPTLSEFDRAPDLARVGVEYYGMARTDVGGIRTRLQLLKAAGLIEERAAWSYQATPLGEEVAAGSLLQFASEDLLEPQSATPNQTDAVAHIEPLCLEIVQAGIASDAPIRLEKAVAQAFNYLGFDAQHLGGSGKTDVLVTTTDAAHRPVRIILDAKAARSGVVNEGAIQFDTLAEHKTHHEADQVVLVGPSFEAGRVRDRAEQNEVALLTTFELANVVRRHARYPRSVATFLKFLSPGRESRREFEATWAQYERRVTLLGHVVGVLAQEAQDADAVTHGGLTSDQIYLIVRGELDPRPSLAEIEAALMLLQHPLLKSVDTSAGPGSKPDAYVLIDRPTLISAKLRMLANSLAGLEDGTEPSVAPST